ncbi:heme O synthase [Gracilibacillus boraciitolerans JCM 21714]|uniref:heme o synthase n=1 Tax=Gracilibacillus boraciitolerans JCM 21714 TaxID=1298598 RepID=W4VG33_9BACI|nr:heme O synthase [Gracilibacillus boraciitolerans JCM 21714]
MTAFAGFWLALFYTGSSLSQYWHVLLVILIGTAFVIAGGCVLNNYYDRDIDQIMKRTQSRPTVTGTIDIGHVLIIGISLSLIGILVLSLASIQTALLGLFGWFSYVVLYTIWTKRRYTINTAIGSLSGAVPPLIGWSAVEPNLGANAWVLFLLIFIWQTPAFFSDCNKESGGLSKCQDSDVTCNIWNFYYKTADVNICHMFITDTIFFARDRNRVCYISNHA